MPDAPLNITIDLNQIDSFVASFPRSGPAVVTRELTVALDESLGYIDNQVVDAAGSFSNTNVFRGSIFGERINVSGAVGNIEASGFVSSSDNEAKVNAIEYGRKPGKMPPVEAIALWVKRRGLGSTAVPTFKTGSARFSALRSQKRKRASNDAITSIAWGVAISIARHGTKGYAVFEKAYNASLGYVEKSFSAAIDRILGSWSNIK